MEVDEGPSTSASIPRVHIFISSGGTNLARRQSLRRSWFQYLKDPNSPLSCRYKDQTSVTFAISVESQTEDLALEQAQHGDIALVDAPEGYEHLWRKALAFLAWLEGRGEAYDYVMHADDDSFVRLDLLLPEMAHWPRSRLYWGYVWDGTGARATAPIRNPANKSHMPAEQYPLDYYPPFASGCGFVLSRDMAQALLAQPLPDYRLLDPPFGIHLAGTDACVAPGGPVTPLHDERVRPYRPLPTFRPDTLVQHYLRPEEMRPYYAQALEAAAQAAARGGAGPSAAADDGAGGGGEAGAPEQLYNTLVALGLLRR